MEDKSIEQIFNDFYNHVEIPIRHRYIDYIIIRSVSEKLYYTGQFAIQSKPETAITGVFYSYLRDKEEL